MGNTQKLGALVNGLNVDASGNVGIGTTASAWGGYTAFQNAGGSLIGTSGELQLWQNAYYNGTSSIYIASSTATRYNMVGGQHRWYNAISGTAGGTITWTQAMTLNASGQLGIGTSSPSSILHLYQANPELIYEGTSSYKFSTGVDTNGWWVYKYGTGAGYKFVINSSGNVGIGTSSPIAPLSIPLSTTNSQITTGSLEIQSYAVNNAWIGDNIYYNSGFKARNAGYASQIYFTTDGAITFYTSNGTLSAGATATLSERMRITSDGHLKLTSTTAGGTNLDMYLLENDGLYINSNEGATARNIILQTGGTERMRIHSNGRVSIGTSTDLGFKTNIEASSAQLKLNMSSGGDYSEVGFYANTVYKAQIYWMAANSNLYVQNGSGGVYMTTNGTSWTSNSDERLKDINSNIDNAIDKLMTLRAVNFTWKTDIERKENLGLIAQDVEKVFPQVIDKSKLGKSEDETEYLGVRYQELVPVLVKAIQELKAEIDILKNK